MKICEEYYNRACQWAKVAIRGNNNYPISFTNDIYSIASSGIGGWHTCQIEIIDKVKYSALGYATDAPGQGRFVDPTIISIGY